MNGSKNGTYKRLMGQHPVTSTTFAVIGLAYLWHINALLHIGGFIARDPELAFLKATSGLVFISGVLQFRFPRAGSLLALACSAIFIALFVSDALVQGSGWNNAAYYLGLCAAPLVFGGLALYRDQMARQKHS